MLSFAEVLREMVIIFQSECVHTMVPMLTQAHVSFQESNLPGKFILNHVSFIV